MFAGAVLAAQPGAALAAAPGSQLAAACASCHRTDGHGGGIPPIAGVDESRIVQLMLANRADPSHSQIMHVVASALTPEEIAAVAHYLASQPAEGQP